MTHKSIDVTMLLTKRQNIIRLNQRIVKERIHHLSKKSWERKECDGCKSYNPECRMGACSIYLYQKQRKTEVKKVEVHDTG